MVYLLKNIVAGPRSDICNTSYSDYRPSLTTTIQVGEKTREELHRIASQLERKRGRRVTYDEAIMVLIERAKLRHSARTHFRGLYATLGPDARAWAELSKLRRGEKVRLERIARASQ